MDSYTITKKEWEALKKIREYKREDIISAVFAKVFDDQEPDENLDEAERAIYELLLK